MNRTLTTLTLLLAGLGLTWLLQRLFKLELDPTQFFIMGFGHRVLLVSLCVVLPDRLAALRAEVSMNSAKTTADRRPPTADSPAATQYLKIKYFSKRRQRLEALARSLGCSWQSIAYEAIDELLDREVPSEKFS